MSVGVELYDCVCVRARVHAHSLRYDAFTEKVKLERRMGKMTKLSETPA